MVDFKKIKFTGRPVVRKGHDIRYFLPYIYRSPAKVRGTEKITENIHLIIPFSSMSDMDTEEDTRYSLDIGVPPNDNIWRISKNATGVKIMPRQGVKFSVVTMMDHSTVHLREHIEILPHIEEGAMYLEIPRKYLKQK